MLLRFLSVLLVVCGIAVGGYFLAAYETKNTGLMNWNTGEHPQDAGKMQNRYLGAGAGAFLIVTGIACFALTSRARS